MLLSFFPCLFVSLEKRLTEQHPLFYLFQRALQTGSVSKDIVNVRSAVTSIKAPVARESEDEFQLEEAPEVERLSFKRRLQHEDELAKRKREAHDNGDEIYEAVNSHFPYSDK